MQSTIAQMKALFQEKDRLLDTDAETRLAWAEFAIEWHALASHCVGVRSNRTEELGKGVQLAQ